MPTREPIANTVLPQVVEKPLPIRTVTTRSAAPKQVSQNTNQNQATTVETSPAADSATTADSVRLSPAASALARKEQAFRQREQAFKQRESEFAALKEKAEKFDQLSQRLSAKDYSEAEKLGLDYDSYVKYKVEQANSDDPLAQKIAALEARLADLTKGQEETFERDYDNIVESFRGEVASLVTSNPDFSSIKALGKEGEEAALQLIIDTWEEDGKEITAEQACKDIEAELYATAEKFSKFPKLKSAATTEEIPLSPQRPSVNTLTNGMQPPAGAPQFQKSLQHLPDHERYAEARRRMQARKAQQQG